MDMSLPGAESSYMHVDIHVQPYLHDDIILNNFEYYRINNRIQALSPPPKLPYDVCQQCSQQALAALLTPVQYTVGEGEFRGSESL